MREPKRITFEGHSDDLIHVSNGDEREEVNALSTFGEWRSNFYVGMFRVRWRRGELAVHALYGPGGIWTFAAQHVDDEDLPAHVGEPIDTYLTEKPPHKAEPPHLSTRLQLSIDANEVEVAAVVDGTPEVIL